MIHGKVIDAILNCDQLRIEFHMEAGKRENIRLGFLEKSSENLFHKCFAVIDGLLQPIQCPSKDECEGNQSGFYSSHYQTYGVNCQGVSDAWLRFFFFEVVVPEKNSNQVAIEVTWFPDILASFPSMYYIIGDIAYLLGSKENQPIGARHESTPH